MLWGVQYGRQTISKGSIYFKLAVKYMFWGVQIFQVSCEIYVLGGPNILKYKDWEEPFFGGVQFFYDSNTGNSWLPQHDNTTRFGHINLNYAYSKL